MFTHASPLKHRSVDADDDEITAELKPTLHRPWSQRDSGEGLSDRVRPYGDLIGSQPLCLDLEPGEDAPRVEPRRAA